MGNVCAEGRTGKSMLQEALALLLRMRGVGKLTHLLRSTPPAQVQPAARAFDEAVLKAYESLADLDLLTAEQQEQWSSDWQSCPTVHEEAAADDEQWSSDWESYRAGHDEAVAEEEEVQWGRGGG